MRYRARERARGIGAHAHAHAIFRPFVRQCELRAGFRNRHCPAESAEVASVSHVCHPLWPAPIVRFRARWKKENGGEKKKKRRKHGEIIWKRRISSAASAATSTGHRQAPLEREAHGGTSGGTHARRLPPGRCRAARTNFQYARRAIFHSRRRRRVS